MLNQKKSSVPQSIPPVCSESSVLRFLGNVLARQNAALFGFLFPAGETHGEYIFKKEKHVLKVEACMFSTVCTWYIHVALAAYVPMLWERFTFGHSCNYSVVSSKNVST